MFLLILAGTLKTGQSNPNFTFHNGSINTRHAVKVYFNALFFTFHNGSINTRWNIAQAQALDTLHSTMFLLIRGNDYGNRVRNSPLHSTMFLLIRGDEAP